MPEQVTNRSTAVTRGIRVETRSLYVRERSDPDQGFYFFAYRICITNEGAAPVRLLRRHWVIRDGLGRAEEVRGDGVIGEQPLIRPGNTHEYTSFCPLPTPWGEMEGSYTMTDDAGAEFEVAIGRFQLIPAHLLN